MQLNRIYNKLRKYVGQFDYIRCFLVLVSDIRTLDKSTSNHSLHSEEGVYVDSVGSMDDLSEIPGKSKANSMVVINDENSYVSLDQMAQFNKGHIE